MKIRPSTQIIPEGDPLQVLRINAGGDAIEAADPDSGVITDYAKVYMTSGQAISSGSNTVVNFDAEELDTASFHDNATNNSRLTIPATGLYEIGYCLALGSGPNVAGRFLGTVYLNGDPSTGTPVRGARAEQDVPTITGGPFPGINAVTIADLATGDYLQLAVYQNIGSITLDASLCDFWVLRLN